MEPWVQTLEAGDPQGAWDLFVERYRRLLFAAIRHYTADHDEVMDVFAHVCATLQQNDLARLRRYFDEQTHRATFSTWLVTVVRHLTVDWFRHRDGRTRLSSIADELPDVQRRIFEYVFSDGRSHVEAYELLRTRDHAALSFAAFLGELRATYRAVAARRKGPLMAELSAPLPPPDDGPAADDAVELAERGALLESVLTELPPGDRLALQLFVVDELPADQVARLAGLPNAKAVYNHVYRALAELRTLLERKGVTRSEV